MTVPTGGSADAFERQGQWLLLLLLLLLLLGVKEVGRRVLKNFFQKIRGGCRWMFTKQKTSSEL